MSMVSRQFSYSCGRLLDADIQRVIRDGAVTFGVSVSHSQVRGWLEHQNYWTVSGDAAKVNAFCAEVQRVFGRLAESDG